MEFEPIDLSKTGVVLPLIGVLVFIVLLQIYSAVQFVVEATSGQRNRKIKDEALA